mgnify:CR=1 FL=1
MTRQENQVEEGEGGSRIVILGGSFSQLHKGHIGLLSEALKISKRIRIGLVEKPENKPLKELIEDYETRYNNLKKAVIELCPEARLEIFPINDPYGPSITQGDLTDIVCTEETLPRAIEINKIRSERGLKPLNVHFIELELAEDGRAIRSTRIRLGEIDRQGKLLAKTIDLIYDG